MTKDKIVVAIDNFPDLEIPVLVLQPIMQYFLVFDKPLKEMMHYSNQTVYHCLLNSC